MAKKPGRKKAAPGVRSNAVVWGALAVAVAVAAVGYAVVQRSVPPPAATRATTDGPEMAPATAEAAATATATATVPTVSKAAQQQALLSLQKGQTLMLRGAFSEAAAALAQAVAGNPADYRGFWLLGIVLGEGLGRREEAAAALERAMALAPAGTAARAPVLAARADLHMRTGGPKATAAARALYETALAAGDGQWAETAESATAHAGLGKCVSHEAEASGTSATAAAATGSPRADAGDGAGAEASVATVPPDSKQGQLLAVAERHQRTAVRLRPQEPSFHFYLGNTLAQWRTLEATRSSVASLRKAIALQPALGGGVAHANLAAQLLSQHYAPHYRANSGGGDAQALREAEPLLRHMIKLSPAAPLPRVSLADALARIGGSARAPEAMDQYRVALQLAAPSGAARLRECVGAHLGSARLLRQQGHRLSALAEATDHIRHALRLGAEHGAEAAELGYRLEADREQLHVEQNRIAFSVGYERMRRSHRGCSLPLLAAGGDGEGDGDEGAYSAGAFGQGELRALEGVEGTADAGVLVADVLRPDEAQALIEAAEKVADARGGWDHQMHTYTHGDLLLRDVATAPGTDAGVARSVQRLLARLLDTVRDVYLCRNRGACGCSDIDVGLSAVDEPWLTRYDAEMNPNARLHYDTRSNVTLNVMLSAPDAYEGGGTYFHASRKTVRLRQGQVLIHPGRLVHKSAPVTGGRRHILVAFTTFTNITVGDTAHQTATFANRDEIKINA